jgi:hypothetical protein
MCSRFIRITCRFRKAGFHPSDQARRQAFRDVLQLFKKEAAQRRLRLNLCLFVLVIGFY